MSNENFFERVYAVARQIPYGKLSYGAIAKALGTARSARMVAGQLHIIGMMFQQSRSEQKRIAYWENSILMVQSMQQLLESEGIEVVEIKL
jgi:methylated-DNA-protein-cysteine methyltransferase-like protein